MPAARSFPLALTCCLGLAAAPAAAQNLIVNPGFDSSLAGWASTAGAEWSAVDAAVDPSSGSARLTNTRPGDNAPEVYQCVPVAAGERYEYGMRVHIPEGQARQGEVQVYGRWYASFPCVETSALAPGALVKPVGGWQGVELAARAPAGAKAFSIHAWAYKYVLDGAFSGHVDDAFVCAVGTCDDSPAPWITSPEYPGFRFRVTITAGDEVMPGRPEASCQPDTVCVSGALPGRSEVFLRILGPRPNGYLWPTVVRFTPSQVDVEIEQLATGVVRSYTLPAIPAGVDELDGLQDRTGFRP